MSPFQTSNRKGEKEMKGRVTAEIPDHSHCENEDAMANLFTASGRRARPWFSIIPPFFTICALLTPRPVEAQAPGVVTTISIDRRGAAVTTTVGADEPTYHPS